MGFDTIGNATRICYDRGLVLVIALSSTVASISAVRPSNISFPRNHSQLSALVPISPDNLSSTTLNRPVGKTVTHPNYAMQRIES